MSEFCEKDFERVLVRKILSEFCEKEGDLSDRERFYERKILNESEVPREKGFESDKNLERKRERDLLRE